MLEDYLKTLPPVLNKDEQKKLIEEYKRTGSLELRNKILSHNLRFAAFIVQTKFDHVDDYEIEDLVQLANIALVQALERFDPEKNITFASFAGVCIENAIKTEIRTNNHHSLKPDFLLFDEITEYSPLTNREEQVTIANVVADEDENIERNYIHKEALERMLKYAKSRLNERDYNLLLYSLGTDIGGRPRTNTAVKEKFNLSHTRTADLISRGKRTIYTRFKKEGEDLFK